MPDVAPQDQSPDLQSLYGGGGLDPKLTSGLADLERQKIKSEEGAAAGMNRTLDADLARTRHAYEAEGVTVNDIKPWNAEAESQKYQYDPIQAFGSVGSVFALLASAFTHQPMENALNGAAAAMNAIKQGKTDEYNRAYKAWKDNADLAVKRHEMMHQQYVDANELLKTNLAAGRAKMTEAAARFGDQKTLFLLEHGMDKELIDLQNARDLSAWKMKDAMLKLEEDHIKLDSLLQMKDDKGQPLYDVKNPGSPRSQEAIQKWHQMWSPYAGHPLSADQEFLAKYGAEHPDATAAELTKVFGEWKQSQKAGSATSPNMGKEKALAVEDYMSKHPGVDRTEAIKKVTEASQTITGNRADEIREKIDRVDFAKSLVTDIDKLLLKNHAISGLGGEFTRPIEVVSNILGSNATDRKEFQRLVAEMQMVAPRILLDTKGRPISQEAGRLNIEIAGLSPGDTGPNTLRAYMELRKQLNFIRGKYQERLGEANSDKTPASSEGDWWKDPSAGRVK